MKRVQMAVTFITPGNSVYGAAPVEGLIWQA
jgi:hypothetical protein